MEALDPLPASEHIAIEQLKKRQSCLSQLEIKHDHMIQLIKNILKLCFGAPWAPQLLDPPLQVHASSQSAPSVAEGPIVSWPLSEEPEPWAR